MGQECLKSTFHSSPELLAGEEESQLFFEAGGLETARHAGYAQNAKSYLNAKHRTLKAVREVVFCFTPPVSRALWSKHRLPTDEWIFPSLLVKHPLDVLASGTQGMGLPRNPVMAISLDVTASSLPVTITVT